MVLPFPPSLSPSFLPLHYGGLALVPIYDLGLKRKNARIKQTGREDIARFVCVQPRGRVLVFFLFFSVFFLIYLPVFPLAAKLSLFESRDWRWGKELLRCLPLEAMAGHKVGRERLCL